LSERGSRPFLIGLLLFLVILALGESLAIYLDYQHSIYFQQYVADNTSGIIVQVIELLVVSQAAAFLGYEASHSSRTSRLGRFTYRPKACRQS